MKKFLILCLISLSAITGCSSTDSADTTTTTQAQINDTTKATMIATTQSTTIEATTIVTTQATTTETTTVTTTTETTTTATTTEDTTVAPVYSSPAAYNSDDDSQTVYIGKTGNKYHYQNCRTLKGNGIPISLSEAQAQGRTSCGVCHR